MLVLWHAQTIVEPRSVTWLWVRGVCSTTWSWLWLNPCTLQSVVVWNSVCPPRSSMTDTKWRHAGHMPMKRGEQARLESAASSCAHSQTVCSGRLAQEVQQKCTLAGPDISSAWERNAPLWATTYEEGVGDSEMGRAAEQRALMLNSCRDGISNHLWRKSHCVGFTSRVQLPSNNLSSSTA